MSNRSKKLGDGELDVMLAIWEAGAPVTGGDILKRVQEKRAWVMSTLMTVLARLVDKGYLECDRSTRTNYYRALVSEAQYKEQESRTFLTKLYKGSLPGLVSCLYRGGAIDDGDIDELRRFLDQTAKEDGQCKG